MHSIGPRSQNKASEASDSHKIYWVLSLQLLAKPPPATSQNLASLPIHLPQEAHSYITHSFSPTMLPLLLGALDLLYESRVPALDAVELDHRGWAWYTTTRPDVEDGKRGWGGKGKVQLKSILDLRRAL